MARKKKEIEHFRIVDGKIIMKETDIANLSDSENTKIAFYVKTLGYDLVFEEEEEKKKEYFNVEKAERYLKKKDKEGLETFKSFTEEADKATAEYKEVKAAEKKGGKDKPDEATVKEAQKAMITAQRIAFQKQKDWFKETYGQDEYDKVRKEY